MQFERIYALMLRYVLVIPRDLHRIFELFLYPIIDIILWGFMGLWVQQSQAGGSTLGIILPASLVLWMIVESMQREVSINLAEEIWAHNIINLFVTPMHLYEWLIAVVILGVIKTIFIFGFATFILWLLLGIDILSIGSILIALWFLLMLSGLAIGLCVNAVLIRYGRNIAPVIWSVPYLILSFSAVFYPMRFLPTWAQYIGRALPISYVFESLRQLMQHGTVSYSTLFTSFILVLVYLAFGLFLFFLFFKKSKVVGLAQLEAD